MIPYIQELFRQVFASLLRNKLRTLLTMAGIAWGIASIVIIVAMGDGFKEGQRKNMKGLGENIVILFGGKTEAQAGGQRAGRRIRLTHHDVETIRERCYLVEYAVGEMSSSNRGTSPYNSGSFDIDGVEPDFSRMRTVPVSVGRFIGEEDNTEARRVAVLGTKVKEQLFGKRQNVVGTHIAINSLPFEVIGLLADKNQNSSYSSPDEKKIFIPYETAVRDIPPKEESYTIGNLDDIIYKPRSLEGFEEARKQVIRVLARNHRFDPADKGAIGIWDTVENAQQVDAIFESMTVFLAVVAFVTLSLGGVGVMNIMLVTVSERTQEIGLRKALGATRKRVLLDFFAEGCLLALMSGSIGWGIAFGLSSLLKLVPMPDMFPGLPVTIATTLVSFSALTLIAIVASLVPAWRAATLTPVEALRYER
ncbi:MAG: ABC transporter permease [Bryobacteraceae bacterium]